MSYKPKKKLTRQEAIDSLTTEEKDELINVLIDILEKKGIDKSQIKQEIEKTKIKASNRKVIGILDIPESTFYYKRQNNHERMKHYEYIESFTIKLFHNTGECMGARKLTKIMRDKYAIRVSKIPYKNSWTSIIYTLIATNIKEKIQKTQKLGLITYVH